MKVWGSRVWGFRIFGVEGFGLRSLRITARLTAIVILTVTARVTTEPLVSELYGFEGCTL